MSILFKLRLYLYKVGVILDKVIIIGYCEVEFDLEREIKWLLLILKYKVGDFKFFGLFG